ncbi:PREDICTED: uncharacterized protein LOC106809402 [Priapulus caudatus]|uniref:Uncharacterized protein LOC106809402 n=1 Tax=Priapulus caudatus TaxID=37621 RepID=A0ABM1E6Y4_PRICU|nr:PREDICTED: uncharacterized protein LOC106809402 [Priapulus caudatus]
MKQFNGTYGCPWCLHKGVRIEKGRGSVNAYHYESSPSPLRSAVQTVRDCTEAVENDAPVHGIKGPSELMLMQLFDCVMGYCIDYLHCVLLGVTRCFVGLWFDSRHHVQTYYIGRQVNTVDEKLLSIKPPNAITRAPRSIAKTRAHWKGSEYMNWLLYYSQPCLTGVLPREYLLHWVLIVHSMPILLSKSISPEDLQNATIRIHKFVLFTEVLYGRENMTFNIHQLIHIPDCVKNWGLSGDIQHFCLNQTMDCC